MSITGSVLASDISFGLFGGKPFLESLERNIAFLHLSLSLFPLCLCLFVSLSLFRLLARFLSIPSINIDDFLCMYIYIYTLKPLSNIALNAHYAWPTPSTSTATSHSAASYISRIVCRD